MNIDVRHEESATFIIPNGEIDMAKAPVLRQTFITVTEAKKSPIVVNFEKVGYIDSAGIATLVECLRFVREYDGDLRLCGASEMVFDVFEIANLDSVFEFYGSEAEALEG
jgi:anti-sigma B factor antagonist